MTGVLREASSKSSSTKGTPASCAIASRCSTPLVDPAVAATMRAALRNAAGVSTSRGSGPCSSRRIRCSPQRRAATSLAGSVAGMSLQPSSDRPSAVSTMAMVLAVNWPPQAPAPGQARVSTATSPASSIRPAPCAPTASNTSCTVIVATGQRAVRDAAAVQRQPGHIHARQRHRRRRNGLVAATQDHDGIQAMAFDGQLDRVGDHLARNQRGAHAGRAHGDAVGDRDGVELDRRAAASANAFGRGRGQVAQVEVAGRDVRPGVHHRHQRARDGRVVEPGGAQHRPRRSAIGAGLDGVAAQGP